MTQTNEPENPLAKRIKVALGDAAEELIPYFRDKKIQIDLLLTDPPYNISRDNNFHTMRRTGIKFGDWDRDFDQTTWIAKFAPFVKDGGSVIIFNSWRNMGVIAAELEKHGFIYKDMIRWVKRNPMPRNRDRRYIVDAEYAIWAVKGKKPWTFNRPPEASYLRPKYSYPLVSGKEKRHPTQKPVALMQEIMRVHSNKDDIVVDPFMGSGSTGIAAIKEERQFFGCEKNHKFFFRALSWVDEVAYPKQLSIKVK